LNLGDYGGSTLLFGSCGEMCLLFLRYVGDRCGMVGSNEDRGRSRRLGAEDRGWSSTGQVLGGQMIKRTGDAVRGPHCAQGDEERVFLSSASKPRSTSFPVWASKPVIPGFYAKTMYSSHA
jgi:hypothetical protein